MGTADKDYFLDVEGNVTTSEEDAHQLLIREGQEISKEMADKYGIGKKKTAKADDEQDSGSATAKATTKKK